MPGRMVLDGQFKSRYADRELPPKPAPMLINSQNPAPLLGRNIDSRPPSALPIINSGAKTPLDVPEPRETFSMDYLTESTARITRVVMLPGYLAAWAERRDLSGEWR
jgi:hypothetical protein